MLRRLRAGSTVLSLVALVALGLAALSGMGPPRTLLLAAAVSLGVVVALLHLATWWQRRAARHRLHVVMEFLEHDSAPGFCTDEMGAIFAQNRAATERFGQHRSDSVTRALEPLFANPDAVIHRLRMAADGRSTAREDVVTRRGHVRIAVHRIPGGFLWRLEDLVDHPSRAADGIGLPILTFGPSGTVLYMNEVMRAAVGERAKRLRDLFEHLPLQSGGLNVLRTRSGSEVVRIVLSEEVNGRQEAFIMPGGEASDGRVALDALPVALLRLDAQGRIVFANRTAQQLLPALATDGERRFAALVEGLGRSVREWVSEAAMGRGLNRSEVVRVKGGASEVYLQITLGRPLEDGEGGLIAVLNDATELKTMEAQFVQSQKMQAIGQLAGGVAHDFNNLLTAISGHCDLLLLRHGEGDEDHADLLQITQNANRAAALVGQLLAFSRKQTLRMERVDLRDTLSDLAHLLNRLVGERVVLKLSHDPALLPIRGDRRQLEQVLMNLVVNARDAMPDGGDIRIETCCRYLEAPMNRDRVSVPAGQFVVVTVTDQGTGIPPDRMSHIFEPFYTTKRPGEGTGLGLSMAYGIVKQSGGYIFCDSTVGKGTQFSLFFPADLEGEDEAALPAAPGQTEVVAPIPPLAAAEPRIGPAIVEVCDGAGGLRTVPATSANGSSVVPPPELPAETPPAAIAVSPATEEPDARMRRTVLLVEDEAPVRAFATRALRLRGYEVLEAASAEDALEQLEDPETVVDLFVTDVMMPGLDGPTWVRQALETRPNVRTIFISGYTQDALSETSAPIPNAVFLPKPFSLTDLTRTVEHALD